MPDYEALYNDLLEQYEILKADDIERIKKVVRLQERVQQLEIQLALLLPDETTQDTENKTT